MSRAGAEKLLPPLLLNLRFKDVHRTALATSHLTISAHFDKISRQASE